jgi:glycopeptide antibiotics resistance protein
MTMGRKAARQTPTRLPFETRVVVRLAYVAIIAIATLTDVGFPLGEQAQQSLDDALQTALTPMAVVDAIRNVVLFAGWGAVWAATAPAGAAAPILRNAVLTAALISASVESLQLFSTVRQPSIVDFVTNTGGALVGCVIVLSAIAYARAARNARSFVGIPAALFAIPYGLIVVLESFGSLFRQERLPIWGGPLERFSVARARIEPSSLWSIPWFDILLFAPAGSFAVAALVERGLSYRGAAIAVTLLGSAALSMAEMSRGFAGYPIEYGPILAHAVGVAVGAVIAAAALPGLSVRLRGTERPLALLAFYSALVLLWSWRPFALEVSLAGIATKLSGEHMLPLRAYLDRVDLFTAIDVQISFLLFVPLGSVLAVWPLRLDGPLRHFLPGVYFAVAVELGQVLLRARWFDITDILVHSAAVVLGWVIVRRAGFRPYGQVFAPAPRVSPVRSRPQR